jgi:ferredoxin
MGDDNKAEVKLDPVPPALEETCREAAEACPEEAIRIDE